MPFSRCSKPRTGQLLCKRKEEGYQRKGNEYSEANFNIDYLFMPVVVIISAVLVFKQVTCTLKCGNGIGTPYL